MKTIFLSACLGVLGALAVNTSEPGPVRITHDGLDKQRPSWSPDGKRLAFARHESGGSRIWQYVLEVEKSDGAKRLTDRKPPDYNAVFSPDGKRLLVVVNELQGTQGQLDIALIRADGSGLKTVVGDLGRPNSHQDWPSWSPDAERFAFSSTHDGNQEIYTARADGFDVVRVTQSPGHDAHPCWSPDGKSIAFTTDRWGGLELAAASPDGTGLVRLTQSPGLDDYAAYSPDGKRLAFVSHRDGQFEVYVSRADGTEPVNLSRHPGRDTYPTWAPDGSGVTFVSDRDGGSDLYNQRVESP